MPTRNTGTLIQIIEAFGDHAPPDALQRLENHFRDSLLIVAGEIEFVSTATEDLRLAVTTDDCWLGARSSRATGSHHHRPNG